MNRRRDRGETPIGQLLSLLIQRLDDSGNLTLFTGLSNRVPPPCERKLTGVPLAKLLGEVDQKLAVLDALAPVFRHGSMAQIGAADGAGNGSNRIGVTTCVRTALDCR